MHEMFDARRSIHSANNLIHEFTNRVNNNNNNEMHSILAKQ